MDLAGRCAAPLYVSLRCYFNNKAWGPQAKMDLTKSLASAQSRDLTFLARRCLACCPSVNAAAKRQPHTPPYKFQLLSLHNPVARAARALAGRHIAKPV